VIPLQAAKTYMERQFETFADASLDDLVKHALQALQASLAVRVLYTCMSPQLALTVTKAAQCPVPAGWTSLPGPLLHVIFWLPAPPCCTSCLV
jgi:hypothetical protein